MEYSDESAGNEDEIKGTQVSGYIAQDIGRAFVQGAAGYAWQRYDSTRDTGATGIATASFKGRQWGARVNFGVPIGMMSSVSFTPLLRLTWSKDKQDAYDESGGGPLGLAVAEKSVDRFLGSLGAQVDFTADAGGLKTRPFLRAFWNHQLDDKGRDPSATFLAGGTTFVTPGQKLDRNAAALGAGINFFTDGGFSAGANYELNLGEASQSSVVQGRVSWNF